MRTRTKPTKIGGFLTALESADPWAVEYVKERRQLYGKKRMRSIGSGNIKRYISALKEAQAVFEKISGNLPLGFDDRERRIKKQHAVECYRLAIEALETLRTPGRIIDAEIAATVWYLTILYIAKTDKPHYQEVGIIVTEIFSDVIKKPGDPAEWARNTARRYDHKIKNLGDSNSYNQTGKSSLLKSL